MKRYQVLLLVAIVTATIAGTARVAQLAHYRLQHIETALGINVDHPDGQIHDAFVIVMDALRHMHNDIEANKGNDREYKPLQEKSKNRTYTIHRDAEDF